MNKPTLITVQETKTNKWVNVGLALLLAGLSFFTGMVVERAISQESAVCHAVTEDSDMSDCDYSDGVWRKK